MIVKCFDLFPFQLNLKYSVFKYLVAGLFCAPVVNAGAGECRSKGWSSPGATVVRYDLLTKHELQQLRCASSAIRDYTDPQDLLIYLGQESSWFFYNGQDYLHDGENYRQQKFVSFSSRSNEGTDQKPNRSQILAYRSYLEFIGVTPKIISETKGSIVFVQRLGSGLEFQKFFEIISDWVEELRTTRQAVHALPSFTSLVRKIRVINLTDRESSKKLSTYLHFKLGFWVTPLFIDESSLNRLTRQNARRSFLVAEFPPGEWDDPKRNPGNFVSADSGQQVLRQIHELNHPN